MATSIKTNEIYVGSGGGSGGDNVFYYVDEVQDEAVRYYVDEIEDGIVTYTTI